MITLLLLLAVYVLGSYFWMDQEITTKFPAHKDTWYDKFVSWPMMFIGRFL